MALKVFKPTSPGRRRMTGATFEEITKKEPEKSLLMPLRKRGGQKQSGKALSAPSRRWRQEDAQDHRFQAG